MLRQGNPFRVADGDVRVAVLMHPLSRPYVAAGDLELVRFAMGS